MKSQFNLDNGYSCQSCLYFLEKVSSQQATAKGNYKFRSPGSVPWRAKEEHAPLCCPFTPQIWAAQLLLNVYSLGNWLHPVKVTSPCCCCSTILVTFVFQRVHPNPDNISITLQIWSQYLIRFCVFRHWRWIHSTKQWRQPTLTLCLPFDALQYGVHNKLKKEKHI